MMKTFPKGRQFLSILVIGTLIVFVTMLWDADLSLTTILASADSDSKLKAVFNRPLAQDGDESSTKSTEKKMSYIDLDEVKLPLDFLYNKLTLVTTFSQNHFQEGLGFIGSAQQHMPNKTIIVYDLGVEEYALKKVKSLCNVQVRRFPYEDYPPHVKDLHTYAFKANVLNLALNEFGVIYYGDASIRFKKSVKELLPDCTAHHGFLGQIQCFDPKLQIGEKGCPGTHDYKLTQHQTYSKIGVNRTEYYNANFSSPSISAGLMLMVNSTTFQSKIMKPWVRCALDVTCIAPPGANFGNHRFEQSAFTLLVYKNMRGEWTLENDPTPHHDSVVSVARNTNGENWHPQYCS